MNNISVFDVKNITKSARNSFIFIVILLLLDILVIQKFAIFHIQEYSSALTTLWSVQATLSTLLIAFLSIFSNKLNDINYGITVKELLMIKKDKMFLNYYEDIVFVFILTGLNFFPVLFSCLNTLVCLVAYEFYLMLKIIMISLKLSVDDQYAEEIAKEVAIEIRNFALNEENLKKRHLNNSSNSKATKEDENLDWLLNKIVSELIESARNPTVKLNITNKSFRFLIKTIQMGDKALLNDNFHHDKILILFRSLCNDSMYSSAIDVSKEIFLNCSNDETNYVINTICDKYYDNQWSKESYTYFLQYLKYYVNYHFDKYFFVFLNFLLNLCKYLDVSTFHEFVQTLCDNMGFSGKEKTFELLHLIGAYLYYLENEDYFMPKETEIKKERIFDLLFSEVQFGSKSLTLSQCISDIYYLEALGECIAEADKEKGLFYHKHIPPSKGAYFLNINTIINDYNKFIIFSLYNGRNSFIEGLSMSFLIKFRSIINDEGFILEKYQSRYQDFSDWCNIPALKNNTMLRDDLDSAIIIKLLDESTSIRNHPETYLGEIKKLFANIVQVTKESEYSVDVIKTQSVYLEVESLFHYSDFSGKVQLMNQHDVFLEAMKMKLYHHNIDFMEVLKTNWDWTENLEEISNFLSRENRTVAFNRCCSRTFTDISKWQTMSEEIREIIKELDKNVKRTDERLAVSKGDVIYINDNIFKPTLTLPDRFLKISSYLKTEEIVVYINEHHYENGRYFIPMPYESQTKIICTYQQCFDYVYTAMLKITLTFGVSVASEKFGACVKFTQ